MEENSKNTNNVTAIDDKDALDWTIDEVANWAREVLKLSETSVQYLVDQQFTGGALLAIPSLHALIHVYGFPADPAGILWPAVETLKMAHLQSARKRTVSETDFDQDHPSKQGRVPQIFIFVDKCIINEEDFEFENREKELKELVEVCVFNQKIVRACSGTHTNKLKLAIASQMMGSGKTWFGRHALKSLEQHKMVIKSNYLDELDKTIIEDLSMAHYVFVNMKDANAKPYNKHEFCRFLLQSLILSCSGDTKTKAVNEWHMKDISMHSISSIAQWFQNELNSHLFFHFDEVDAIAEACNMSLKPESSQLACYYKFWNDINPLHQFGFIYCSGRSPQLFLIGQHNFGVGDSRVVPPGQSKHMFFDRLLLTNINNMVSKCIQKGKLDLEPSLSAAEVSDVIFNCTAGVPRFVIYTLNYLAELSAKQPLSKKTLTKESFFQSLFSYAKQNGGEAELYSWQTDYKDIYFQLVLDAILAVPYSIADVISTDLLPVKNVQLLQMIWLAGVFTAKTPQYLPTGISGESVLKDQLYIIVPPLVANAMLGSLEAASVLTIAGLGENYTPVPESELLEYICKQCFTNQLCTKIANRRRNQMLHGLFPFLKQTILPDIAAQFEKPYYLPKFVNTQATSWKAENDEKVTELLKTQYSEAKSQSLEVPYEYWQQIVPQLQQGLYIPAQKSFSGNFYVVLPDASNGNKLWLLIFQYKAGTKQELTISSICEDIYKSFDHNMITTQPESPNTKFVAGVVLVFVGGNYPAELQTACEVFNDHALRLSIAKLIELQKAKDLKKESKTDANERKFGWKDNANLEVLLLNNRGKKHLLSAFHVR